MAKHAYWLTGLLFSIALTLSGVFFAGDADHALAQTQPELKFLNSSLTQRARHVDPTAQKDCESPFNKDAETATARAFVLLSGSQKAKEVKFIPYPQRTSVYELTVQAEGVGNEQDTLSIDPSDVMAFTLTFLICSNREAPGFFTNITTRSLPPEWSSISGQLVVKDSNNPEIVPGTVALQLNRPALGYEQAYFLAIVVAAVIVIMALGITMFVLIRSANFWQRLMQRYENLDFKAVLVIPSTATAAILGTLVTATILPNDTFFMSKGQFATLNVLFGLVVVFATVLYNNWKNGLVLWIGAVLALGAGTGEALTICIVLKEMAYQGSLPGRSALFFIAILLLAWFILAGTAVISVAKRINADAFRRIGRLLRNPWRRHPRNEEQQRSG